MSVGAAIKSFHHRESVIERDQVWQSCLWKSQGTNRFWANLRDIWSLMKMLSHYITNTFVNTMGLQGTSKVCHIGHFSQLRMALKQFFTKTWKDHSFIHQLQPIDKLSCWSAGTGRRREQVDKRGVDKVRHWGWSCCMGRLVHFASQFFLSTSGSISSPRYLEVTWSCHVTVGRSSSRCPTRVTTVICYWFCVPFRISEVVSFSICS